MANPEHVEFLKQGVEEWNKWRLSNLSKAIDLSKADLRNTDLRNARLSGVNLREADLREAALNLAGLHKADMSSADLIGADLSGADLSEANLSEANLSLADMSRAGLHKADMSKADMSRANLSGTYLSEANLSLARLSGADLSEANLRQANLNLANLRGADLRGANLSLARLSGADLIGADLRWADMSKADLRLTDMSKANLSLANLEGATLIETIFKDTNISGCRIFGISAWKLKVENLIQSNLIITEWGEPEITVDNLEVAQFVYLLLHNEKLRNVIDTLTTKSVLILGRFTTERKVILEAIRKELRKQGYLPILFDFEKPVSRDLTETISTLAHLSRFIIADITDAKSIPQELQAIIPNLPSVAIQPIILASQREYAMFEHFRGYRSVLELYPYDTPETLIASLGEKVIEPAEAKVIELRPKAL